MFLMNKEVRKPNEVGKFLEVGECTRDCNSSLTLKSLLLDFLNFSCLTIQIIQRTQLSGKLKVNLKTNFMKTKFSLGMQNPLGKNISQRILNLNPCCIQSFTRISERLSSADQLRFEKLWFKIICWIFEIIANCGYI